jgi:lantibiotic modifying enzyme
MASEAAKAVAQEVIKTVENGGRPVITTIAPKKGYSRRTAHSGKIQKTKSYQSVIAPLLQRLEEERDRAISMMRKRISKAKYRDLTDSMDKLTKNIQLLSGKATENVAVGVKHLTDDQLAELADGGKG